MLPIENMTPPRGVPTTQTEWGRRARYCPDCETEIRWTGHSTGLCACNGSTEAITETER
jgi:hypothetical protein